MEYFWVFFTGIFNVFICKCISVSIGVNGCTQPPITPFVNSFPATQNFLCFTDFASTTNVIDGMVISFRKIRLILLTGEGIVNYIILLRYIITYPRTLVVQEALHSFLHYRGFHQYLTDVKK